MSNQEMNGKPSSMTMEPLEILALEMAKIAMEIKDLPQCGCGEMSNEKIMQMQQVDFCSQRLHDIANLMRVLSQVDNTISIECIAKKARLEHIRDILLRESASV